MAYRTETLIQNTAETDAAFLIRVNTFISDQAYYYGQVGGSYPPAPSTSKSFLGFPPTAPSSDITYWDVTSSQMKRIVTFSYEDTYYYVYLGVVPPLPGPPPAPTAGNIAIWGPGGSLYDGVLAVNTSAPNFTNLSVATTAGEAVEYSQFTSALSGYVPTSRNITINGVTQNLSADRTWTISGGVSSGSATQTSPGVYDVTILGVSSYTAGDSYIIKFDSVNAGASTLNINSIGAVNIYKNTSTPISSGDIKANQELTVVYDGTNFQAIGLISDQLLAYVHNAQGAVISKGQVVYAYQATGDKMSVKLARADSDATSAKTIGMVYDSSIGIGGEGYIIIQGVIEGLNTAAYSAGDTLYLSGTTYGGTTNVKPYAPTHLVYVGIVEKANAGNGQIYVRCQNGYELDEIHDVDLITVPPVTGDVLSYNSVTQLWSGNSIASILGYTPATSSRNITINGSTQDLSADRTWSVGTVTSVGLSLPSELTVSGSPVTGSGSLSASWASQAVNEVFAGPGTGVLPGTPAFRPLVSSDIPNIDMGKVTTGNLPWSRISSTPTTLSGYGITAAVKDEVYFTIPFISPALSPADSTTYYIGAGAIAPSTTATNQDMSFGYDITVIGAVILASGNTASGTTEDSTMSVRNTTTATSTTIGTFKTNGSSTVIINTTVTGLSINIDAGDSFCLQWATPAYATNPTACSVRTILICKRR